jgi:ActR/RegA family two-component response regulator
MGKKKAHKVSVRNPVRKTALKRHKHTWENNNKMDIQKIRWEGVDRIYLAQDMDKWPSLVNKKMNLWVL